MELNLDPALRPAAEAHAAGGATGPRRWRLPAAGALAAASPAMLFLLVLYLLPVLLLLAQSFEHGSLANYRKALTDGLYVRVLLDTLLIAGCTSVLCLLLAYPLAYALSILRPPWPTIGMAFVLLPFWTSVLVRTYGWMVLLGRNGVINRSLADLGWIDGPLPLLNNWTGVLIGMTHVLLPYMVFPLYAAMRRVDGSLLAAAQGLGASGLQVFTRVFLPLTLPGVLAGLTLVFVLSIGFFITPALLGGGKVPMAAVLIEQQVRTFLDWGFAAALSAVLLAATLAIYLLLRRVLQGRAP